MNGRQPTQPGTPASDAALGPMTRWLVYLRERFPPAQYAIAVAAFTWAVLAYTRALDGDFGWPPAYPFFVAWAVTLLLFLQLRILDEFKDYEEDSRYRPYRPVPRGLVTLRSLGLVWVLTAVVQIALSWSLDRWVVLLLAIVFAYSGLMRVEFFVRRWLKQHALAYMGSHMLIIPMIALYVAACTGTIPEFDALAPMLGLSYLNFTVFEIGRKICSPAEERTGVETYSALWGPRRAVFAWLGGVWGAAAVGLTAAHRVGVTLPYAIVALALACSAAFVAARFLKRLEHAKGDRFKAASAVWLLGIHLVLGASLALHS